MKRQAAGARSGGSAEEAVSRETLAALTRRFDLPSEAIPRFAAVLGALATDEHAPSAVRDPQVAVDVHLADSLAALGVAAVREARLIGDVGSGAGFPGLPLAIALPNARVDLIEASARKTEAGVRLAAAAGLVNAQAITARAEVWAAGEGRDAYDVVTARAVAALPVLVEYAAPLLTPGGSFVAWKGERNRSEERAGAEAAAIVGLSCVTVLAVQPFPQSRNRHLHVYSKVRATPSRFPRRPGMAAKRPLARAAAQEDRDPR